MKTRKLLHTFFSQDSSRMPAIIALVSGLAIGTVVGVLFAPESGRQIRNRIRNLGGVSGGDDSDEQRQSPPHQQVHGNRKRPKSDIKSLVHEAHTGERVIE